MSGLVPNAPSIFISYAHKDNEGAERWLDRLLLHLDPLVQEGLVGQWSDKEIALGTDWHHSIQTSLRQARAAILLISPNFLASSYIRSNELPVLLKMAADQGTLIIPVIIGKSLFKYVKFKYPDPQTGPHQLALSSFQAANSPDKPLNSLKEYEQDEVLVGVAERLMELVNTPFPAPLPPPSQPLAPSLLTPEPPREPPLLPRDAANSVFHSQAVQLRDALGVLPELMSTTSVAQAVAQFQASFASASQQIELLSGYKDLHDQLHELQFQCYDRVLREAGRFPADEMVCSNFREYEATLRRACLTIRRVLGQRNYETGNLQLELETAWGELSDAVENKSQEQLTQAAFLFAQVMNYYPSQINTRLNVSARALCLTELIEVMATIRDAARHGALDQVKLTQFTVGVEALLKLQLSLDSYLNEHDRWQRVDNYMRQVRLNSAAFVIQVKEVWPLLRRATQEIINTLTDELADDLREACEQLEEQTGTADASRIREAYLDFQRRTGWRFFDVDKQLKQLCANLRLIVQPLDALLRMIQ